MRNRNSNNRHIAIHAAALLGASVPVIMSDGTKASVKISDLGSMTRFSGTVEDRPVNSIDGKDVGRSVVLKKKGQPVFACTRDEMLCYIAGNFSAEEIAAVRFTKTTIVAQ